MNGSTEMVSMQLPVLIDIIIFVGNGNYDVELAYINEIKVNGNSSIFKVNDIKEVCLTDPDETWGYSTAKLFELASSHLTIQNTTICFIDRQLEGNYFRKKLSDYSAVVTFYQTREIYEEAGVSIEKFIYRNLYKSAIRHLLNNDERNKEVKVSSHHRTKGCLYDFCKDKYDVVINADKLRPLCSVCEAKLNKAILPRGFVSLLKKELTSLAIKDNTIHLDDETIIRLLNTIPEHKMAKDIFVPLLIKMGLHGVKFTGGAEERGIDIEYYEISQPEGDKQYIGVQFKKGDITYSSGGVNGSIVEIKNQAIEAFEKPIVDTNAGTPVYIHRFVVATTGDIKENARRIIGEARFRGDSLSRNIKYWDRRMLSNLIRENWQVEFTAYFSL